jgi:acetyl esterase/lipase
MRVLTALRPVAAALAIAALGCSDYLAVPCRATDAKPVVFRNPDAQSRESFYVPPSPLPDGKPGDVIWAEAIDAPKGANAWKVLYLSRSADMEPIAVSGWVVAPKPGGAESPKPVVAWAHGTTGLADECAPTQRRLDEPTVTNLAAIPMLSELIAAGYVVAATDYEGLGTPGLHTYGVSDSEARTVLDSIRAAGKMPTGAGSRALVFGESQGGRVAVVVNEMASDYAPEIELVGVVSSGTAVPLSPDRHAQFMVESGKGVGA